MSSTKSNGNGFSVKQVIDISQEITGQELKINKCELEVIIRHPWQWHKKRYQLT